MAITLMSSASHSIPSSTIGIVFLDTSSYPDDTYDYWSFDHQRSVAQEVTGKWHLSSSAQQY